MREDALKALLSADETAAAPVRDIGFVIAVMEKVERRRFVEGVLVWVLGGAAVTLLLALIMPYVTPALVQLGNDIVPAVFILAALGMVAMGWTYLRPVLRDYGISV